MQLLSQCGGALYMGANYDPNQRAGRELIMTKGGENKFYSISDLPPRRPIKLKEYARENKIETELFLISLQT